MSRVVAERLQSPDRHVRTGEVPRMMASPQPASTTIGKRYWIIAMVAVILGLSLLFSIDFVGGGFRPDAWSNFIAAVQISTLVVVVAILVLWVRGGTR